jgi:hypothetical protein
VAVVKGFLLDSGYVQTHIRLHPQAPGTTSSISQVWETVFAEGCTSITLLQWSGYKKPTPHGGKPLAIELLHATKSNLDAMFQHHFVTSRACINSWNKAHCLFPASMMLHKETMLLRPLKDSVGRRMLMEEEIILGFNLQTAKQHTTIAANTSRMQEIQSYRQLGDNTPEQSTSKPRASHPQ